MNQTTNLNAKVARRETVGENILSCAGEHSAMLLGIFQKTRTKEWGFRLELEKMFDCRTEFEQIHHTGKLQRLFVQSRRPCLDVLTAVAVKHTKTSWHVPGKFQHLFDACKDAVASEFPKIMVRGYPSRERIGAFEVVFRSHEGAKEQLLYSALNDHGWLPSPKLVVQLVHDAIREEIYKCRTKQS